MNIDVVGAIPNHGLFDLTDWEWGILLLLTDDLTTAEMADQLCLTVKSVSNYRNSIGSKLDVQGKNNLARFARKHRNAIQDWHRVLSRKSVSS